MQNAQPPTQVQDAFLDAIKAREDQERIINEAKAYQADVVPKARGEANAILAQAQAYQQRVEAIALGDASRFEQVLRAYRAAPEITRDRLYLEAIESVLANTTKVLVDIPEGNNIMYLPLDQIIRSRADSGAPERRSFGSTEDSTTRGGSTGEPRRSRESSAGEDTMMNLKALLVLLAGLGVLAGAERVHRRSSVEVAILLQFGKVERTDLQAGPAFQGAGRAERHEVRCADPDPRQRSAELSHVREEERDRGFVREVANRGRPPVLHFGRRRAFAKRTIGSAK